METLDKKYFTDAVESRHWKHRKSPASIYFELIKQTDKHPEGKRLLDVGCASGIEVEEFQKLGFRADGADINENFIAEAKKNHPDLNFTVANAEKLPFKDESYNYIFCTNTLFHTDIGKSISEFCRVVDEKGKGVISFDLQIINLDENKVIHSDTIEHLNEILRRNNTEIEILGDKEERIDIEPFKHKHVFHKVIFKKSNNKK